MTTDASNRRRLAALLLCAALLPGCSDDETLTDDNGGTLTDPTGANVLLTQSFPIAGTAELQRPTIVSWDVAVPEAGIVRAEVDWTTIDNDLDIVVARDDCRSGIAAWNGDCTVYDIDRSSLTKPARVDFSVNAALGLRVYVYNFSNAAETAVLQVLHRP